MGNEASHAIGAGAGAVGSPSPSRRSSFGASALASPKRPRGVSWSQGSPGAASAKRLDRSIQRMDQTIRKRVRGGVTYNMKIVLRGAHGTGKTSLFQRLKGEPIPEAHEPTPQLQSATINWSYRTRNEENVKCEIWDVVDQGFLVGQTESGNNPFHRETPDASATPLSVPGASSSSLSSSSPSAIATAMAMATPVDATNVDVYHETHGVVFLLDVTKPHTLEYVRTHLADVPAHIPTLILGNFRDCAGHQRKIYKEDIEQLLAAGSTTANGQTRPHELLYFECSLLNCYGLAALHQYFGVPFLQLKLATLRQQVRLVENEMAHLKHDVQEKIAEQRYSEYVERVKTSGSDIRTGKRVATARAMATSSGVARGGASAEAEADTGEEQEQGEMVHKKEDEGAHTLTRSVSSGSDIVVSPGVGAATVDEKQTETVNIEASATLNEPDLPDRSSANVTANMLKIEYVAPSPSPPLTTYDNATMKMKAKTKKKSKADGSNGIHAEGKHAMPSLPMPGSDVDAKSSAETHPISMNLEDFQVPKPRQALESFYSDDDSEEEEMAKAVARNGSMATTAASFAEKLQAKRSGMQLDGDADMDVVVASTGLGRKPMHGASHKQLFIDSDDDSDSDERQARTSRRNRKAAPVKRRQKASTPRSSAASTAPVMQQEVRVTKQDADEMPPLPVPSFLKPTDRAVLAKAAGQDTEPHKQDEVTGEKTQVNAQPETVYDEDKGSSAADSRPDSPTRVTEEREVSVDLDGEKVQRAVASAKVATDDERGRMTHPAVDEDGASDVDEDFECGIVDSVAGMPAEEEVDADADVVELPSVEKLDGFFSEEDEEEGEQKEEVAADAAAAETLKQLSTDEGDSEQEEEVEEVKEVESEQAEGRKPSGVTNLSVQIPSSHGSSMTASPQSETEHSPEPAPFVPEDNDAGSHQAALGNGKESDVSADEVEADHEHSQDESLASNSSRPGASDQRIHVNPPSSPPDSALTSTSALEAFLNDSDSDSDAGAHHSLPLRQTSHARTNNVVLGDDDDDDDEDDEDDANDARFAAYEAKRSSRRRNITRRKSQRGEIDGMVASNDRDDGTADSNSLSSSTSSMPSLPAPAVVANRDVLAAIQQAQVEAMRMLETSSDPPHPIGGGEITEGYQAASLIEEEEEVNEEQGTKKKRRSHRSSPASSTSSSYRKSRHSHHHSHHDVLRSDEDIRGGSDGKKKKKKDKKASSRSKKTRATVILTDDDSE